MTETRDIGRNDNYFTKLSALLPGEVTGLYLFIRSLAQNDRALDWYLAGFAVLIAIIFYLVAPQLLKITDQAARLLYVATFLLWVCSIEIAIIEHRTNWPPVTFTLPAFIAIWTFAVPFIFDKLKETTATAAS